MCGDAARQRLIGALISASSLRFGFVCHGCSSQRGRRSLVEAGEPMLASAGEPPATKLDNPAAPSAPTRLTPTWPRTDNGGRDRPPAASRPAPPLLGASARNVPVDAAILEALQNGQERKTIADLEALVISFVMDPSRNQLEFPSTLGPYPVASIQGGCMPARLCLCETRELALGGQVALQRLHAGAGGKRQNTLLRDKLAWRHQPWTMLAMCGALSAGLAGSCVQRFFLLLEPCAPLLRISVRLLAQSPLCPCLRSTTINTCSINYLDR
eukprot:146845-Chlamydomonas_euryale.AAC.2